MVTRFLLCLLLAGCFRNVTPQPLCRTDYVPLYGSSRCAELQSAIEVVALEVFPPLTEKLRAQRWGVKVDAKLNAHGQTYCDSRFIVLDTDDWAQSALAHELFHVLECPWENPNHARWKDTDSAGKALFDLERLLR